MKISIITASYNYADYIKETIESVINQTYENWEMIIVDDGSKDDSVRVIESYCEKNPKIKLYQHKNHQNKGLAETLKLAISKADSDWIVFLESDDTITPDYLSKKLDVIKKYPDIRFIFNDVKTFGDGSALAAENVCKDYFSNMYSIVKNRKFPANLAKDFSYMNFVPTFSCVMLKKEVLKNVSFKSIIPQWLDTFLWSQILGANDCYYIDEKLTNWRIHSKSYNHTEINKRDKIIFDYLINRNLRSASIYLLGYLRMLWYLLWKCERRKVISLHYRERELFLFRKKLAFGKQKIQNFSRDKIFNPKAQKVVSDDLISVIVPAYNEEKNILKCLSSLIEQTYTNLEIIVVYLDSSDRTLELINSVKDSRIKIAHQTSKTGPGGARNIGLDNAKGKYLGFTEADDCIPCDFYEKLHASITKNDSDVAIGEIIEIFQNNEGSYITRIKKDKVYCSLFDKLLTMNNGAAFNKLFKTSIIKENNVRFTDYYRFEDNPFLLKMLYYSNSISLTNKATYYYFCDGEQWSESYKQFLIESIPPIAKEMVNFSREKFFNREESNLVKTIVINSFVRNFLQNENVYQELHNILGAEFFDRHQKEFEEKFKIKINNNKDLVKN